MNPQPSLPVHQASSDPAPNFPPRATSTDIKALLTGPALRHLEPRPGGKWTLVSRVRDTIRVKYSTRDDIELLRTNVHLATNPETAADLCWKHVYGYTPGQIIVTNVPYTSPEAQSLTAADMESIDLGRLDLSQDYDQPPVGSNIGDSMPPATEIQFPDCASAQAPMVPPIPQLLPTQHFQVANCVEVEQRLQHALEVQQQLQHAVDVSANWTAFDVSMTQLFQAPPNRYDAMHQVESGNFVSWNWELPDAEMRDENEW
ncbi:hypothetical protein ACHAPT_013660 [Fusarium lateritium]